MLKRILNSKLKIFIILIVIILILIIFIKGTYSYITNYVRGETDNFKLNFDANIMIDEYFKNNKKYIRVGNSGNYPVYVRVRVFTDSEHTIQFQNTTENNWTTCNTNYYCYNLPLAKNTSLSNELIFYPSTSNNSNFNAVAVYEYSYARYNENGTPYADWNYSYTLES